MPFSFFKKSKEKKFAQAPISQDLPLRTPRKLRKASIRSSNAPTSPQRLAFILPLHEHHSPPIRVASMQYPDEELLPPQPGHLHGVPFHSSIPHHDGSVDGWRAFPPPYRTDTLLVRGHPHPRVSGASAMPPENPEVSRYYSMAHELEHPQPKPLEPQPPSRTWSPIPSVLRESSSQIGRKGSVRERSVNGSDDSWGEGGMTTTSMQGQSTPFKQVGDLRHSIGQKQSDEKMQYVEYKAPGTPKIHEPNGLGLMQPQPIRPPDENLTRRTPSPEIIEAKVVERPLSWVEKDDDPEMEADVYHYIVPAGLSVVFQDEAGTKITRVGKVVQTLHGGRPLKSKPIIVHDTFGKELYRDEMPIPKTPRTIHGRIKGKSRETLESSDHKPDEPHHPPWAVTSPGSKASTFSSKTFLIDEKGNLIPM